MGSFEKSPSLLFSDVGFLSDLDQVPSPPGPLACLQKYALENLVSKIMPCSAML